MTTTEIEYTHESTCEHCGQTLMGYGGPTDFTLTADAKEKHGVENTDTDHDCEFTEYHEYEEPVVQEVEY